MPAQHLEICDRFRLCRLEAKLTQQDFATALGLTISYIKMVETRKLSPNLFSIQQLAKVTSRSYEWIIDGTGKK
jgi:transcriptional regulator with XRE-family HTH domain